MIERFLIEHCSATLASIKAANLCNMTFSSKEELEDQISYWSACLEPKGIRIFVLREHETRALVYVYREGLIINFIGLGSTYHNFYLLFQK